MIEVEVSATEGHRYISVNVGEWAGYSEPFCG